MTPEQCETFVEIYQTCGDLKVLDEGHREAGSDSEYTRMNFGVPAQSARGILECLPPYAMARMCFVSNIWKDLTEKIASQQIEVRTRLLIAKLSIATDHQDGPSLDFILRSLPSGFSKIPSHAVEVARARETQRNLALKDQALHYVDAAVATGLPDAAAAAALDEAISLGLEAHPSVAKLTRIIRSDDGQKKALLEARNSGWLNKAKS